MSRAITHQRHPDGTRTLVEPCDLEPIVFGVAEIIAGVESALTEAAR